MDSEALRAKVKEYSRRDAWTQGREFFEAQSLGEPRSRAAGPRPGVFIMNK
jgi:hypothetical protein